MNTEIWKNIEGFEGLYQVSNLGRVKSLNYRITGKEKVLRNVLDSCGYPRVNLWKNEKQTTKNIHRLVALHFVSGYKKGLEVNHIDENKQNNNALNLEWCTRKQNMNHGTRNERTSKPVIQYDKQGNEIARYFGAREAERQTGIDNRNICACCLGKQGYKSAGGYIWRYTEE